ncbi:MAG: hypothetical protein R3B70_06245 [Polyangiaceae bacterium]
MKVSREQGLSRIRRAASVVELRMRLSRVVEVLPYVMVGASIVTTVTLAGRKLFFDRFTEARAIQVLAVTGGVAFLVLLIAALRKLPPRAGTVALDKAHQLSDRLTNAVSFAEVKGAERTPLMEVAIDDALVHTTGLKPSKAAPIRPPWELVLAILLLLPLIALALLEVPIAIPVPTPVAQTIDAPPMSPDDIELFKEAARELDRQNQSPEMKAAIEKFNQLIEDLANKRLDRTEAFRKMEELERELMKGAEMDAKKLEEELKNTGMELSKSDLAKPVGDALQKKDLDKAAKEMHALAEQLKKGKMDKGALDRLKKAMEEAAKQRKDALAAINEKRQDLRDEILKKKEEKKKKQEGDAGAKDDEGEEQLIKDKERQLEKLDREAEQQERAGRSLDRLDRDLAKAAADLAKEMGLSADDLEKAAEDINRMQQEEMSDKDKEELRKRLQELRELLRQQGQAGKERMKRMLKFGKRARGQSGQQGQGQGQQGQQGQGQDGEDGQDGQDGQQGQQGQGQGQDGQGQGTGPGKGVTIGLGQGQGQGDGQGPGQGQGQDGNGGDSNGGQPGQGFGTGHDGDIKGDRTDLKGQTTATRAEAADTGQGPSNSEVILSAAERGFKGGPYKKVYKDYRTYAEQQINKDEIPDGYRFYVRRYFQLIRPRE